MPEDAEERCGAEVAAHHCPLRNGNGMAQVARQQPALLDQLRARLEDAQRRVEDQKHLDEAVSERTQLKLEHRIVCLRPMAHPLFSRVLTAVCVFWSCGLARRLADYQIVSQNPSSTGHDFRV